MPEQPFFENEEVNVGYISPRPVLNYDSDGYDDLYAELLTPFQNQKGVHRI